MNKFIIEIDSSYYTITNDVMLEKAKQILKEKENIVVKSIIIKEIEKDINKNTIKYKFEYE